MRAARGVLSSLGVAIAFAAFAPAARAADPAPLQTPTAAQAPNVAQAAPVAQAVPPPGDSAVKRFPRLVPPTMSHYLQFGLAVLPGTGYRAIFPYQNMINCGEAGKRVCTSRLATFLDVQPSFGFASHWDVLADLRFGLEQDFTGTHEFAVAPGVRYWVDPQERAKFFATIQVAFDTTAQHDAQLHHNDDVAARNSNGFMYEIMRNFGVYAQFGETIGFVRWLRFEIDGGLGLQARFP